MADFDRMVSFIEAQKPEVAQKLVVQFLKHGLLQVSPHCTKEPLHKSKHGKLPKAHRTEPHQPPHKHK